MFLLSRILKMKSSIQKLQKLVKNSTIFPTIGSDDPTSLLSRISKINLPASELQRLSNAHDRLQKDIINQDIFATTESPKFTMWPNNYERMIVNEAIKRENYIFGGSMAVFIPSTFGLLSSAPVNIISGILFCLSGGFVLRNILCWFRFSTMLIFRKRYLARLTNQIKIFNEMTPQERQMLKTHHKLQGYKIYQNMYRDSPVLYEKTLEQKSNNYNPFR